MPRPVAILRDAGLRRLLRMRSEMRRTARLSRERSRDDRDDRTPHHRHPDPRLGRRRACSRRCMRTAPIPSLDVTIATKGLLGKCGCTRMVQGGYNVALHKGDSIERHFMDTIEGGKWLPHQELAWTLVTRAIERVRELENEIGCFFDRNPDGSLHGKAFAGQTFDRTVHKGDLTGIEIINRLMEQVWARPAIRRLEEHRALALDPGRGRRLDRRRADGGHPHRRAALRRRPRGAARDRRRPHHVPLPHALRRQEHGRHRHGAARRPGPARHGDGAVPPDRPARRARTPA